MFFFNLSAVEFLALLSGVSSLVVVLYLLDRSRKKHVVPTLRFWQQSLMPSRHKHRRKIQQPWSLILQLLGIALLLLAIAQLRIGSQDKNSRDHVLLVDGSSWMAARGANGRPLLVEAKTAARRYIRALPSADRVMLVRVDGLATPMTGFEDNRQNLEEALGRIEASTSALNLGSALDFGARVMQLEGKRPGEIVYAGVGRLRQEDIGEMPPLPANLRLLPVQADLQNVGLRKVAVRRAPGDGELWQVYVTARNYGDRPRTVPFLATFGGAPVYTQRLTLAPGADVSLTFEFRTAASGWVETRLEVSDAVEEDNRATVELPEDPKQKIVVYSNEPELLRPVLRANSRLEIVYRRPEEYRADTDAIVILDRFQPNGTVKADAIWIQPPTGAAPIGVRSVKQNALLRWRADQELAAGLRTRDIRLESTQILGASDKDMTLAEVEDGGPVIVARPGEMKAAVFGFHPMRSTLRYELATPLLFANVLRWMAPALFLRVERQAGSVGTVTLPLEEEVEGQSVRVTTDGRPLPFTVRDGSVRFYSAMPGTVRVALGQREMISTLSLPELGEVKWEAPKTVRTGFARVGGPGAAARDIWYWLAAVGTLLLLAEWLLFGRKQQAGGGVLRFPFLGNRGGGGSEPERRIAS